MEGLFWVSAIFVFYTYFGYPILLWILTLFTKKEHEPEDNLPSVSMIICAFNEEKRIRKKIENCFGIQYPPEKLEIIIISDASTDGTDRIIQSYADDRLHFLRQEARQGKTKAQNAAIAAGKGEILVFSDVSTLLDSEAIRLLVSNFAESSVGLVSGEDWWYAECAETYVSECQSLYVRYEMLLRRLEAKLGSMVNASGCFYGVRGNLISELPDGTVDDLAVPFMVIRKGFRVSVDPRAVARVPKTASAEKEYGRRIRIVIGGLSSLFKNLDLLNPWKYKYVSFELISHKLFRWLVPIFLAGAFWSNVWLMKKHSFYILTMLGQIIFYILGWAGYRRRNEEGSLRALSIPYFFCSSNLSIVTAWIRFLKGERKEIWEPSRSD
jgi:cellulose synthase/poly-beta-1,6-N-acetylglucosamine synthase-like glycosyltransferase